jgi:hypothetical protein
MGKTLKKYVGGYSPEIIMNYLIITGKRVMIIIIK